VPLVARGFAETDIPALTRAVQGLAAAHDQEVLAHAQQLQARLGHAASADLPPFYRILAHLIEAGDIAGILAMNDHFAHRSTRAAAELSPAGDYLETFPVTDSASVPHDALVIRSGRPDFYVSVDDSAWRGSVLHLDLLLRSGLRLGPETEVTVSLVSDGTALPLPTSRLEWRRPLVGVDLAGVRTEIDLAAHDLGARRPWSLQVTVEGPRISHTCTVAAAPLGRAQFVPTARVPDRPRLLATFGRTRSGDYGITAVRPASAATGVEVADESFVISGWLDHPADDTPEVLLRLLTADGPQDRPVEIGARTPGRPRRPFRVRVPFDSILQDTDYDSPVGDRRLFTTRLVVNGADRMIWSGTGLSAAYAPSGTRLAMAGPSLGGELELGDFRLAPLLETVVWQGQTLALSGCWLGAGAVLPSCVVLEHFEVPSKPDRIEVPLEIGADGAFAFQVDAADLVRCQTDRPDAYDGRGVRPWHLLMPFPGRRVPLLAHRTAMASYAAPRMLAGHRVSWKSVYADVFQLAIR